MKFLAILLFFATSAYAQTARTITVGKDVFVIKKVQYQGCFGPGAKAEEVWYKNKKLRTFYGVSSTGGVEFEVQKIYPNKKAEDQIIVEGLGEFHISFKKPHKDGSIGAWGLATKYIYFEKVGDDYNYLYYKEEEVPEPEDK